MLPLSLRKPVDQKNRRTLPFMTGIEYAPLTVRRARQAWRCSRFTVTLLEQMRDQSVPLSAIAGNAGVQNQYTTQPLLEFAAESQLMWLIQVGLLRREVDGQGITDSFRLTPLGQQLLECERRDQSLSQPPRFGERLRNFSHRWFRLT